MTGWAEFIAAFAVFMLSHMLPSRPALRGPLVAVLGRAGFITAYSLLSIVLLGWLIVAAGRAPTVTLWYFAPWQTWVPTFAMLSACLLGAYGLGAANPLSFGGRRTGFDPDRPGIAGVTRHPLLLALALWAGGHMVPNGDLAHILMFGVLGGFALLGMWAIDRRQRRTLGDAAWREQTRATSLLPFSALISGRWKPRGRPSVWRLLAGLLAYAVLTGLHPAVIGAWPHPIMP